MEQLNQLASRFYCFFDTELFSEIFGPCESMRLAFLNPFRNVVRVSMKACLFYQYVPYLLGSYLHMSISDAQSQIYHRKRNALLHFHVGHPRRDANRNKIPTFAPLLS